MNGVVRHGSVKETEGPQREGGRGRVSGPWPVWLPGFASRPGQDPLLALERIDLGWGVEGRRTPKKKRKKKAGGGVDGDRKRLCALGGDRSMLDDARGGSAGGWRLLELHA